MFLETLIPVKEIIKKSKDNIINSDDFTGIKILTIGRLSKEKGYDMALNVCKRLVNEGYNIRWYICGEGSERQYIEREILKHKLTDKFILLGNQSNPYPYIKEADIYVQTSYFEGYCTTTNEARILNKPIITTNVSGANEQIKNNENGLIVDINEDEIYKGLKLLIDNKNLREKFTENLKK